ncbi:hypothetical protein JL722_6657 [Aureococcus anophagefferens]|nr:hypothetical protein JL722_6657 [Aureococcus anophagefferens]
MREQITAEDEHSLGGRGNAVAGHAIAVRLARTYGVFNEESPHFAEFVDKIHRGEIDLAARGRRAALKSGEADASFFADKIGRSILGRLRHNADMLASYANLAVFVFHIVVFMAVIALQRNVEGTERLQFYAISDALHGFSKSTTEYTAGYLRDSLLNLETFEHFLRGDVLGMIFQDSECGDGFCEPRDENPSYDPDPYEREGAAFVGCRADCGIVDTTVVEVHFLDLGKLVVASQVVAAALEDGWLGESAEAWGRYDADGRPIKPAAGWNVCHATDRSWGTPETVCLFDGDVQINGLPYRTAELDVESSSFGESKVLDLYAGDWELRYAFDGFAWTYPYKDLENPLAGKAVQIGFPAIRGQICTRDTATNAATCETWAPCPDADACACSYVDGAYRCFDDDYWAGFNAETMTHSEYKDADIDLEMAAFPDSLAYEAVAKWWSIPRNPAAGPTWGDRSAPAAVANASAWDPGARKFTLVLLNVYVSLTWLGNTLSIVDAAGAVVTTETLTDNGCAVVDVLLSEGRTYAFATRRPRRARSTWRHGLGALRRRRPRAPRVRRRRLLYLHRRRPGRDLRRGRRRRRVRRGLPVAEPTCDGFATPSTVVSVFDYRCYGDGASAATDGDATAAPTPAPAAYAPATTRSPRGPKEFGDRSDPDDGYAYTEASGTSNDTFILRSPAFKALREPALLTFKLHAYGDRVAYMNLEGLVDGSWTVLFRTVYDQGHRWHDKAAEVPAATTQIRWRGFTYKWTGDIAIDDVAFATSDAPTPAPTALEEDDVAFATSDSPTPAPTAFEDDGRLRCYAGWKRYSEGDAGFLATQWQQEPSSEIITCPAGDTHCVLVEYPWPFAGGGHGWNGFNEPYLQVQPLVSGAVPAAYFGLGGCWSDFERMLLADMIHAGYDFPEQGPLDPRLCMNVKSEYYTQHVLLSDCLACAGELCNVPGAQDPTWYANVFDVTAQALGVSGEYYLDDVGVVNRISATVERGNCVARRMGDGTCDPSNSGFACLHDGGDCLDDEHAYVAAPWLRHAKGEAGALDDWPYALVLGGVAHATVPHVLHRAVAERVFLEGAQGDFAELRVGNLDEPRGPPLAAVNASKASEFWVDVAKLLPSAACPECAAYEGDHATVPFKVEVGPGNKVGGYNPEEYDMFAKPATGQLRSRWLPRPNRVIWGPMVTQRRAALGDCPAEGPFADLRDKCDFHVVVDGLPVYMPNRASEAPFGVDPTFLESSFLYKGANDEALKNELYDNATELKGSGLFDTLTEGAYFNKQTLEVTVTIATVNVETGLLTYMEIVAERVKEGGIMLSDKFAIFDPRPYDGATDYFRAFLELVLVGTVLFLISMELGEMRDVYGETGALWGYLGVGNLLDLASYAVSLAMFVKWGTFWQSTTRIKPRDHYDAFADPFAVGRITEASGDEHEDFSDLFASSLTMMKALCGMFDDSDIEVTYINAAAFYWSFMVLSFFLLLNSLLAIIVEAYTTVVEEGRLEQQTDPLPFALWKARQDLKALGWRYFLPRSMRHLGPGGLAAAADDLILGVEELSAILECWFDAEDRPLAGAEAVRPSKRRAAGGPDDDAPAARSHKGREVGRAAPHLYARVNEVAGCPVSWRIFAWRWQKDLPDDPIVCLDHHFMRCVFHVLHKRYETRMEREGAPPPEPPLSDAGVDVVVWNVMVRYGTLSADVDQNGTVTPQELAALTRLLRLQKAYDENPDLDDGAALCAALNYFNGASTKREMEANFARELDLHADLAAPVDVEA